MRLFLIVPRWGGSFLILLGLILGLATTSAAASRLTITWSDRSTNEDGFKVDRKTGTTGAFAQIVQVGTNVTSFVDSTVTAGTSYCYRVRAFNSAGHSSYSNEACATAPTITFTLAVTKTGAGIVSSSPVGISCGSDCSQTYTSTTSVTLTATPASGYAFSGWSGGGCSGTGTCTLLINTNTSVTATFTVLATTNYTLSVTKVGFGTVTSAPAGISCGTDCSQVAAPGTVFILTATPASGYRFNGWSGACTGTAPCAVTLSANKTVTATFTVLATTNYTLSVTKVGFGTVTSAPAGISCGTDCSQVAAPGTVFILTATPASGYRFNGWSGACTGTAPCAVTLSANKTVTATFTVLATTNYTLSVTKVGFGTVTSTPAGIPCGTDCSQVAAPGTVFILTATPASGYRFNGWSGACTGTAPCAVTLSANKTVTATFTVLATTNYTLSVTKVGFGTVTSAPAGISCGTDCSQVAAPGTVFILTATPASGYRFNGWSGACTGTAPCAVTLSANKTVTATFTVLAPGLVAAYSFGTGSGITVKDSSGLNNTGTISGAVWTTAGRFGNALSFNGVNNWVTISDAISLDLISEMTLEAWVYPTTLNGGLGNGWRTVILKQATNGLTYALYANGDTNRPNGYVAISGDKGVFGPTQLPLNTWTHLATTYDGSRQRLYINGVEVANRAQSGTISTSSGVLRLGGNSVWGEYFQGRIDEVRIYNRALTSAQITTDMNTAVTP